MSRSLVSGSALEKKLSRYLLAGTAVLSAPVLAQADSFTFNYLDEPTSGDVPISVFFPGGASFNMTAASPGTAGSMGFNGISFASVNNAVNVEFVGTEPAAPAALAAGTSITTGASLTSGTLRSGPVTNGSIGYKGGNFQNGVPAYVGLNFQSSGQTYTGWAEVVVNQNGNGASSATLIEDAYNNTPGDPILAGQGTPEPSSLALFALGGAATLALLRRRRKAEHAS